MSQKARRGFLPSFQNLNVSQWNHISSPVRVEGKQTISTHKVMTTVFWDRHEVLLVEFIQQGTTISAAAYCATLTKLRRVIRNKRYGLLTA